MIFYEFLLIVLIHVHGRCFMKILVLVENFRLACKGVANGLDPLRRDKIKPLDDV
jgi:hypothetical protein